MSRRRLVAAATVVGLVAAGLTVTGSTAVVNAMATRP